MEISPTGLRRISHYDVWSNSVRRSILFDAKADILVYGMAEQTVVELAEKLKLGQDFRSIRGICYIHGDIPAAAPEFTGSDCGLADHAIVSRDKEAFMRMFQVFYENLDPLTANRLYQKQDTRYLVVNPPSKSLSVAALASSVACPCSSVNAMSSSTPRRSSSPSASGASRAHRPPAAALLTIA